VWAGRLLEPNLDNIACSKISTPKQTVNNLNNDSIGVDAKRKELEVFELHK
jgi:hypothetical protein